MSDFRWLAVVGSQWGDEGKGKIVDVLADRADIIARYQGGANAGHTVDIAGEQFVLHQIPSGILHPNKRCLLGNGVVLDAEEFFKELETLHKRGINTDGRIGISGRAHLLLNYHKLLDKAREGDKTETAIGTTGRGIGPAYEEKVARRGIRVTDLKDWERAKGLVASAVERTNKKLNSLGQPPVSTEEVLDNLSGLREKLLSLITDTGVEITDGLAAGKKVLLEGAQGALLDVDHGTYPFVTSSSTTASGASLGVGIGPRSIDSVIGVVKAYTTRVGNGPMPTELTEEIGESLRKVGHEYGATTGRPRRCGWFDAVVVRYAARVNSLTGLAITKLDVLDSFSEIKLATAYEIDGKRVENFPDNLADLEKAAPIYETLPGWQSGTNECKKIEDLPENAQKYLHKLESVTGVPIVFVSVGTQRDQIINV